MFAVRSPFRSGSGHDRVVRIDQAERILDAAAGLFASRGINAVGMGEVASAAGCSRATLYRYFVDRRALHLAFVHREAHRIGSEVVSRTGPLADPADRLTAAILLSVHLVRQAPSLLAWFGAADAGTTAELVQSDEVLEALGLRVVGDRDAARWLIRVVVSLLIVPGQSLAEERAIVERYVVPSILARP